MLVKFCRQVLWLETIILVSNIAGVLWIGKATADSQEKYGQRETAGDAVRQFMEQGQKRRWKATENHRLKVDLFVWEKALINDLREANILTEGYDVGYIAKNLQATKKNEIIGLWKIRNKAALQLLEYWRQHPDKIGNDKPTLSYSEKLRQMTDVQLYNTLCHEASLLQHYLKTPLAETNRIAFFLLDPSVYLKEKQKLETDENSAIPDSNDRNTE